MTDSPSPIELARRAEPDLLPCPTCSATGAEAQVIVHTNGQMQMVCNECGMASAYADSGDFSECYANWNYLAALRFSAAPEAGKGETT